MHNETNDRPNDGAIVPKKRNYIPPRGIERACGGIIESVKCLPYTDFVKTAEEAVACDWDEKQRKNLTEAIKLNLVNQKEYPFDLLQRKYGLPCSRKIFRREARRYVQVLAKLCGFE